MFHEASSSPPYPHVGARYTAICYSWNPNLVRSMESICWIIRHLI